MLLKQQIKRTVLCCLGGGSDFKLLSAFPILKLVGDMLKTLITVIIITYYTDRL